MPRHPPVEMAFLTIGRLVRIAKVSRTSLLYYERLGLLRPVARSAAGYRLYGPAEVERIRTLRVYREAGMAIPDIRRVLSTDHARSAAVLEARLIELHQHVAQLRAQQRLLARLLAQPETMKIGGIRSKARWVSLLKAAGFSESDMDDWHRSFEAEAPDGHQRFLAALGMPPQEVQRIRSWSRRSGPDRR